MSIDAHLELVSDAFKMINELKMIKELKVNPPARKKVDFPDPAEAKWLKQRRLIDTESFLKEADWTFDPTKFGFVILTRPRKSPDQAVEWYAEKNLRRNFGNTRITFHVRKKKDGQYAIRKSVVNYDIGRDIPDKIWDCAIPDHAGAVEVLITIGAFRVSKFRK